MTEDKENDSFEKSRQFEKEDEDKIGKFILKVIFCCLAVLLVSQCFLFNSYTRIYLSRVDRLEGEPISDVNIASSYADRLESDNVFSKVNQLVNKTSISFRKKEEITVRMIVPRQSEKVFIVINGQRIENMAEGSVTFNVYDGDYVEIDASGIDEMCQFVLDISDDSKYLKDFEGLIIKGQEDFLPIGKIKLE